MQILGQFCNLLYLSITPQLQAILANSTHVEKMCYQANHVHKPGVIKDMFNGSYYQTLLNTIVPAGETEPFFYGPLFFSTTIFPLKYISRRNIAFMLPQSQVQKIGIHLLGHSFKN